MGEKYTFILDKELIDEVQALLNSEGGKKVSSVISDLLREWILKQEILEKSGYELNLKLDKVWKDLESIDL